jgi:hypothetical protein
MIDLLTVDLRRYVQHLAKARVQFLRWLWVGKELLVFPPRGAGKVLYDHREELTQTRAVAYALDGIGCALCPGEFPERETNVSAYYEAQARGVTHFALLNNLLETGTLALTEEHKELIKSIKREEKYLTSTEIHSIVESPLKKNELPNTPEIQWFEELLRQCFNAEGWKISIHNQWV